MTKSELRRSFLAKRMSLDVRQTITLSQKITDRFFSEVDLAGVKTLHTFLRSPRHNEVDTSNIYYKLWRDFHDVRTFAPRADLDSSEMASVAFGAEKGLIENSWGIREPAGSETIGPDEIDVVLVPLLCFDEVGHRVGYGKGFYDRLLATCKPDCKKVGLSFFSPVEQIDDIDGHDVALNICITPQRSYRWDNKKGG